MIAQFSFRTEVSRTEVTKDRTGHTPITQTGVNDDIVSLWIIYYFIIIIIIIIIIYSEHWTWYMKYN